MGAKNCEWSEIFTLLVSQKVTKLQFHAGRRHGTPGSETKESLLLKTIEARVSTFFGGGALIS